MNVVLGKIKNNSVFIITLVSSIFLDQITKLLVQNNMALYESRRVFGNFFRLTYIKNHGIAFGLFQSSLFSGQKIILGIFSIVAVIFLIYMYAKLKRTFWEQLSIGLIMGGAFGNLYNRFILHSVTDFCDFGIGKYRWFTFNMADAAIVVGVILLFIIVYIDEKKIKKNKKKLEAK